MTESQIVEAVVAWIAEAIPEVADNSYDYIPTGKAKGLPDVAVDIVTSEVKMDDPEFQLLALQQVALQIRRLGMSFMVSAGVDEAGARAATLELRTFVDRITAAVLADHTLGQRVPIASPFLLVDYEPAFVEYSDGTRGREVTVQMSVAEPLHMQD
jgi:hypothetical protein